MMKRLSLCIPVKIAAIVLFICIFLGLSLPFNLVSTSAFAQSKGKNKAELLKECTENLKELATAVYLYSTDYQGHYPKELSSIIPMYYNKSTISSCPLANKEYKYSSGIDPKSKDPDWFIIECQAKHKGVKAGYPRFSSKEGLLPVSLRKMK